MITNSYAYCTNKPTIAKDTDGHIVVIYIKPREQVDFSAPIVIDEINDTVGWAASSIVFSSPEYDVYKRKSGDLDKTVWKKPDGSREYSRDYHDHSRPDKHPVVPHDHDEDDDGSGGHGPGLPPDYEKYPDPKEVRDWGKNEKQGDFWGAAAFAVGATLLVKIAITVASGGSGAWVWAIP